MRTREDLITLAARLPEEATLLVLLDIRDLLAPEDLPPVPVETPPVDTTDADEPEDDTATPLSTLRAIGRYLGVSEGTTDWANEILESVREFGAKLQDARAEINLRPPRNP